MLNVSIQWLSQFWGALNSIFYCLLGLFVFIRSDQISQHLGYMLEPFGQIEFKATYGGFMLTFGITLLYFIAVRELKNVLIILALSYFGFLFGRLFAMLTSGYMHKQAWIYLGVELVGLCLTLVLLRLYH